MIIRWVLSGGILYARSPKEARDFTIKKNGLGTFSLRRGRKLLGGHKSEAAAKFAAKQILKNESSSEGSNEESHR
jgi:hypothetical protein